VVKVQLDAASALLPGQPDRARESVEKAAGLAAAALEDVRRSVGTLRTEGKRPPLPEALRDLTREAGLPVTLRLEGDPRDLPPGIEHALFRSAQEGLTNVRKHAHATVAELVLDYRAADHVALVVRDEGRGADSGKADGGFGLTGIRERIELLGGKMAAGNRPAGGFALSIEVPA
jgi:signal transduction histidine kinase